MIILAFLLGVPLLLFVGIAFYQRYLIIKTKKQYSNEVLRGIKDRHALDIHKIIHTSTDTVVWFNDNSTTTVKRIKGDKDSIYTAVAYAVMKHKYGTLTNYIKEVNKNARNTHKL